MAGRKRCLPGESRRGGWGRSFKTQFEIKKVTIIYGSPGSEALNFMFVAGFGIAAKIQRNEEQTAKRLECGKKTHRQTRTACVATYDAQDRCERCLTVSTLELRSGQPCKR